MFTRIIIIFFITAVLNGCSVTSGGAVLKHVSGYSGQESLIINPHGVDCDAFKICPSIGAQWSGENPQLAILSIRINDKYVGILSARLMIDGTEYLVQNQIGTTSFDNFAGLRFSDASFVVQLELIRKITKAKSSWIRINTVDGYVENRIHDSTASSKAYHALNRFITAVDGATN